MPVLEVNQEWQAIAHVHIAIALNEDKWRARCNKLQICFGAEIPCNSPSARHEVPSWKDQREV